MVGLRNSTRRAGPLRQQATRRWRTPHRDAGDQPEQTGLEVEVFRCCQGSEWPGHPRECQRPPSVRPVGAPAKAVISKSSAMRNRSGFRPHLRAIATPQERSGTTSRADRRACLRSSQPVTPVAGSSVSPLVTVVMSRKRAERLRNAPAPPWSGRIGLAANPVPILCRLLTAPINALSCVTSRLYSVATRVGIGAETSGGTKVPDTRSNAGPELQGLGRLSHSGRG